MPLIPDDDKTIVQSYTNSTYPGTITSNIKPTVRRIITTPKIIAALRKRFDWDEDTFHLVDWDIFSPVYKRHKRKSIQLTHKYVTNSYQLEKE